MSVQGEPDVNRRWMRIKLDFAVSSIMIAIVGMPMLAISAGLAVRLYRAMAGI